MITRPSERCRLVERNRESQRGVVQSRAGRRQAEQPFPLTYLEEATESRQRIGPCKPFVKVEGSHAAKTIPLSWSEFLMCHPNLSRPLSRTAASHQQLLIPLRAVNQINHYLGDSSLPTSSSYP